MPAAILSSPFLTLEVVERALQGELGPAERAKLLAARVHLLSEAPAPAPSPGSTTACPNPVPLLTARADLAEAYLSLSPPDAHAAEAELLAVQAECRRLLKRQGEADAARAEVAAVRERALGLLVRVEEGLGRAARAERWRGMMGAA
ncbi:hypothetical protein Q8F55_000937 [Vanrija albida]|uniref:Uncharacterized protein n=1 Tax=Vanrija albida TaxID=181172 RepID=A0ABR3QEP4_9TREE